MKKALLSILMICSMSCINNLSAQCTPDSSFKTSGTFPASLDTANVGVLYNQVIQYHIAADTVIFVPQLGETVNAKIDTLWITGVKGMPAGFSYDCHNADCKVVGGKTGCATLKGTPFSGQGGLYPLVVMIKIRATAFLGGFPIAQTVNDSNSRYTMVVKSATGTGEIIQNNDIVLYPNPATNELQIFVPDLKETASYSIINSQGQLMQEGPITNIKQVNKVDLTIQQNGIYFIEIKSASKKWHNKFVVN